MDFRQQLPKYHKNHHLHAESSPEAYRNQPGPPANAGLLSPEMVQGLGIEKLHWQEEQSCKTKAIGAEFVEKDHDGADQVEGVEGHERNSKHLGGSITLEPAPVEHQDARQHMDTHQTNQDMQNPPVHSTNLVP